MLSVFLHLRCDAALHLTKFCTPWQVRVWFVQGVISKRKVEWVLLELKLIDFVQQNRQKHWCVKETELWRHLYSYTSSANFSWSSSLQTAPEPHRKDLKSKTAKQQCRVDLSIYTQFLLFVFFFPPFGHLLSDLYTVQHQTEPQVYCFIMSSS